DAKCLPATSFHWTAAVTAFDPVGTALNDQFGSSQGWGSPGQRYVSDVNGDGLSDIVGFWAGGGGRAPGAYVALSNGATYQQSPARGSSDFTGTGWLPATPPRLLADVNADGRADVVGFGLAGVTVGLSNGAAFVSQPLFSYFGASTWDAVQNPRMVADVNGDG